MEWKSSVLVDSVTYVGGVAKILHKLVPFTLGLDASWHVIAGNPEFLRNQKCLYNVHKRDNTEVCRLLHK